MRPEKLPDKPIETFLDVCPRVTGEKTPAYQAFWDYCRLNCSMQYLLDRYKAAEAEDKGQSPTNRYITLKSWKSKYHWDCRRRLWQDHLLRIDSAIFYAERREFNHKTKKLYTLLHERAEIMARAPLYRQTISHRTVIADRAGQEIAVQVQELHPAKWTHADLLQTIKLAEELGTQLYGEIDRAIDKLTAAGFIVQAQDEEIPLEILPKDWEETP